MSLLAVLLALLLEQVRAFPHHPALDELVQAWARWTRENFDAGRPRHAWVVTAVTIGVPVLAVALLQFGAAAVHPVLVAVLQVAVLYVTLGFRHFSHHFTVIRLALEQGDELAARRELGEWLHIGTADMRRTELLREVLEHGLLAAHRHVFGVFFWFLLSALVGLGPAGAVLYRMAGFVRRQWAVDAHPARGGEEPASATLAHAAAAVFDALDMVPARLTAFGFAVVGDFESAIATWRRDAELWLHRNDGVVLASAAGALGVRLGSGTPRSRPDFEASRSGGPDTTGLDPEAAALGAATDDLRSVGSTPGQPPTLAHLHSAVGLVWRAVVLWLILLALLTLAAWWAMLAH